MIHEKAETNGHHPPDSSPMHPENSKTVRTEVSISPLPAAVLAERGASGSFPSNGANSFFAPFYPGAVVATETASHNPLSTSSPPELCERLVETRRERAELAARKLEETGRVVEPEVQILSEHIRGNSAAIDQAFTDAGLLPPTAHTTDDLNEAADENNRSALEAAAELNMVDPSPVVPDKILTILTVLVSMVTGALVSLNVNLIKPKDLGSINEKLVISTLLGFAIIMTLRYVFHNIGVLLYRWCEAVTIRKATEGLASPSCASQPTFSSSPTDLRQNVHHRLAASIPCLAKLAIAAILLASLTVFAYIMNDATAAERLHHTASGDEGPRPYPGMPGGQGSTPIARPPEAPVVPSSTFLLLGCLIVIPMSLFDLTHAYLAEDDRYRANAVAAYRVASREMKIRQLAPGYDAASHIASDQPRLDALIHVVNESEDTARGMASTFADAQEGVLVVIGGVETEEVARYQRGRPLGWFARLRTDFAGTVRYWRQRRAKTEVSKKTTAGKV